MADFALPLPVTHRRVIRPAWLLRVVYLLRVRSRLIRRRRRRNSVRTGAHDWVLALPQSRHGG